MLKELIFDKLDQVSSFWDNKKYLNTHIFSGKYYSYYLCNDGHMYEMGFYIFCLSHIGVTSIKDYRTEELIEYKKYMIDIYINKYLLLIDILDRDVSSVIIRTLYNLWGVIKIKNYLGL